MRTSRPAGTGSFATPIVALPNVYGTHHIGASTEQAQEAIAAEAVRVIRVYKETGRVPNVVNLATRRRRRTGWSCATAIVPACWRTCSTSCDPGNLNVQETENVIFEGAEAAVASINLDAEPPAELLDAIEQGSDDILSLQVVKI